MSQIQIFDHEKFGQIRTITDAQGEPWFVAADVCRILDIANPRDAITRLDDDEKDTVVLTDGATGNPSRNIVNESGLYELVFGSRKQEAKEFKKWIKQEVLPSIRKHGAYMTAEKIEEVLLNPDTIIQLATDLKTEREKRKQFQAKIAADKDKVAFAEQIEKSIDDLSIRDYAKILFDDGSMELGPNQLFELFREKGVLDKDNKPNQEWVKKGYFRLKPGTYKNRSTGNICEYTQPRVTGKGQIRLRKLIIKWIAEKAEVAV